jgi:small conductance mechanosensitive channel
VLKGWLVSEQGGQRWLWNLVKFLLILVAFYFGASIIASLARKGASRIKNASQLLVNFLGKFVKQVIMLVGVIVALAALEVNIAPLLAAVGAAGFVVAFALQDTLSNFASGLLILAYRPFDEGDVIEAAGISGMVDSVSLFSTHIRTFDNKMMVVPNNDIWGGTITNATASDTRRVDMVFGIGYGDDIAEAKSILESLVHEHELVLNDPAPVVRLHELADSSVNFICRPWTKTGDYWAVYWDITHAVKESFDSNGISIPFPQRDIHVYQEPNQSAE